MTQDFQSPFTTIKAARKAHVCSWCKEEIEPLTTYERAASRYDGYFIAMKMHPECRAALEVWMVEAEYDDTWNPGHMTRGCPRDPYRGDDPCENCTCYRSKEEEE